MKLLEQRYGEHLQFVGIATHMANKAFKQPLVMEVYKTSSSFSLIITDSNNCTFPVLMGEDWMDVHPPGGGL